MAEQSKTKRWSNTAVTDSGNDLLTEFAAGKILKITGAYGFAGMHGEDLTELSELPDGREHPLTIESVVKTDNSVSVCIQVTSIGNPEPYKMEAIGITAAARDPGDEDDSEVGLWGDKLLMVIEDTEDENGSKGVTIPAETDQLYTFKLYAVLTITNKERLEVSVSTAGIATIGAIQDAIDQHNKDPEAHTELIKTHNEDPAAHPSLTARTCGIELTLNGSVTLTGNGDPTSETVGKEGQHYINTETGAEFECTEVSEGGYYWEPVNHKTSIRDLMQTTRSMENTLEDVNDRLGMLELMYRTQVNGNPFKASFSDMSGLVVTGVWNEALKRVEF